MTFFRLGIFAAAICLSSCTVSTAPEPAEFKLSAEALSKQYRATRKTGSVRLYAQEIQTTRDEWGRETHVASGGALLVKEAMTPIYAQAPSISITPEFSEVRGQGTVKKGDRLYIGQDESAKIRIDGAAIVTEGAVMVRGIANEAEAAEAKADAQEEKAQADAEVKADDHAQAERAKAEAKAKSAEEAAAKAKKVVSAPAKKSSSSSKPKPKPKQAAPAKPKAAPVVDRSRLLNLMREPMER